MNALEVGVAWQKAMKEREPWEIAVMQALVTHTKLSHVDVLAMTSGDLLWHEPACRAKGWIE